MKKTIAIVTPMLCAVATAMAQHTVSGTVTDLNGEPLAGVAVMVQDSPSPTGTTTDLDGTWSLSVSPDAVLEFSSLGYRPVTVNVNGRGAIDVSLEEDREILRTYGGTVDFVNLETARPVIECARVAAI